MMTYLKKPGFSKCLWGWCPTLGSRSMELWGGRTKKPGFSSGRLGPLSPTDRWPNPFFQESQ
jgi:hypothetical protein